MWTIAAQVDWLGMIVGDHLALSLLLSDEPVELIRTGCGREQWHWYYNYCQYYICCFLSLRRHQDCICRGVGGLTSWLEVAILHTTLVTFLAQWPLIEIRQIHGRMMPLFLPGSSPGRLSQSAGVTVAGVGCLTRGGGLQASVEPWGIDRAPTTRTCAWPAGLRGAAAAAAGRFN